MFPRDISTNRDLFDHLKLDAYKHLEKKAEFVLFERKYPIVGKSVFPSIQTALAKLKEYCIKNKIIELPKIEIDEPNSPQSPIETTIRKKASISTTCTDRADERSNERSMLSPNNVSHEKENKMNFFQNLTEQDKLVYERLTQSQQNLKNRLTEPGLESSNMADLQDQIYSIEALLETYTRLAEEGEPNNDKILNESIFDLQSTSLERTRSSLIPQNSGFSDKTQSLQYGLFRPTCYRFSSSTCIKLPKKPEKTRE